MNQWYYWQETTANLADNRLEQSDVSSFLNKQPMTFFDTLLNEQDIFSYAIDDSNELRNDESSKNNIYSIRRDMSAAIESNVLFDIICGCDCSKVWGVVKHVLPNSQASEKNIERGMWFDTVNSISLDNLAFDFNGYSNIFSGNTLTFRKVTLENIVGDCPSVSIGDEVSINNVNTDTSIISHDDIITRNGKKIGYLMFLGFYDNNEIPLNNAFTKFMDNNISDLIVDLRYNPGGLVRTADSLIGMIAKSYAGRLAYKYKYNTKITEAYNSFSFDKYIPSTLSNGQSINSIDIPNVYFITTDDTASASELVMFALQEFINVIVVGDTTFGKPFVSVTLYDEDNNGNINTEHTYAIQPIVAEIRKTDGSSGHYYEGLTPDYTIQERLLNLGQLGSESEPLLQQTLGIIDGSTLESSSSRRKMDSSPEVFKKLKMFHKK